MSMGTNALLVMLLASLAMVVAPVGMGQALAQDTFLPPPPENLTEWCSIDPTRSAPESCTDNPFDIQVHGYIGAGGVVSIEVDPPVPPCGDTETLGCYGRLEVRILNGCYQNISGQMTFVGCNNLFPHDPSDEDIFAPHWSLVDILEPVGRTAQTCEIFFGGTYVAGGPEGNTFPEQAARFNPCRWETAFPERVSDVAWDSWVSFVATVVVRTARGEPSEHLDAVALVGVAANVVEPDDRPPSDPDRHDNDRSLLDDLLAAAAAAAAAAVAMAVASGTGLVGTGSSEKGWDELSDQERDVFRDDVVERWREGNPGDAQDFMDWLDGQPPEFWDALWDQYRGFWGSDTDTALGGGDSGEDVDVDAADNDGPDAEELEGGGPGGKQEDDDDRYLFEEIRLFWSAEAERERLAGYASEWKGGPVDSPEFQEFVEARSGHDWATLHYESWRAHNPDKAPADFFDSALYYEAISGGNAVDVSIETIETAIAIVEGPALLRAGWNLGKLAFAKADDALRAASRMTSEAVDAMHAYRQAKGTERHMWKIVDEVDKKWPKSFGKAPANAYVHELAEHGEEYVEAFLKVLGEVNPEAVKTLYSVSIQSLRMSTWSAVNRAISKQGLPLQWETQRVNAIARGTQVPDWALSSRGVPESDLRVMASNFLENNRPLIDNPPTVDQLLDMWTSVTP